MYRILMLAILISSCLKKDAGEVNPDLIGEWHSAPYAEVNGSFLTTFFIIKGENSRWGYRCIENCKCDCTDGTAGDARTNKKGTLLYMGEYTQGNPTIEFEINEPPSLKNGQWVMTIGGEEFTKQ